MSKNRFPEYLFRFLLNDRFSDLARLFIRLFIGLMTRFAVLPLIAAMTVAAFFTYTPVSLAVAELPMLYLSIYFFLFIAGPGKWSLDYLLALPYFPDTKELPLDDPFPFE